MWLDHPTAPENLSIIKLLPKLFKRQCSLAEKNQIAAIARTLVLEANEIHRADNYLSQFPTGPHVLFGYRYDDIMTECFRRYDFII